MKIKFAIYFLLLFSLFAFNSCNRNSGRRHGKINTPTIEKKESIKQDSGNQVKVVGITDGDTFKGLTSDYQEIKFRIYGIDSPERKQAFSNRAKQYLSDLIYGKTVEVKLHRKDRYGRSIVWIFTEDGRDVSAEMLKAGMAWHYKEYDSTQQYSDLEYEARLLKAGLWVDKNPKAPWDFRKEKKKKKSKETQTD
ncbi:MAG: thermonuclease family protein [Tannerella sp.]|jgi:endonuclease YncB( thermonuclease family)|nr:thermonuclease family protein [Tannerella sp.]